MSEAGPDTADIHQAERLDKDERRIVSILALGLTGILGRPRWACSATWPQPPPSGP